MLGGYCLGLVPQVPRVTSYDPNEFGYDPIPSSNKWLVNQVLCTRYGPTTPG
jgi:hypothetical protein